MKWPGSKAKVKAEDFDIVSGRGGRVGHPGEPGAD